MSLRAVLPVGSGQSFPSFASGGSVNTGSDASAAKSVTSRAKQVVHRSLERRFRYCWNTRADSGKGGIRKGSTAHITEAPSIFNLVRLLSLGGRVEAEEGLRRMEEKRSRVLLGEA